jgi:hypothetical protein
MLTDLQERLQFLLNERLHALALARMGLQADLSDRGMLSSSAAIRGMEKLGKEHVDLAVPEFAAAVNHAAAAGVDQGVLKAALDDTLERFLAGMQALLTAPESAKAFPGNSWARPEELTALCVRARSLVRQYQAGFISPANQGGHTMFINMTGATGVAIQQGTSGSTQEVHVAVDSRAASEALSVLSQEISSLAQGRAELADALTDIDTLRAQLNRTAPRTSVLRELGSSLRTVVEGTLAGALSPAAVVAAGQLWLALGLG